MQNATASQMKMLLTRIGDRSKMVITGDLAQADREHKNGLLDFIRLMREGTSHRICLQEFDRADVQRHPVVKEVLRLYRDY
jgi:phosphate starvation-inducible PhoH-like protein